MLDEQASVLVRVTGFLEALEIPYFVAGSYASNVHGFFRATADADLVADMKLSHVESFTERLGREFYFDSGSIRDAVLRRASFNVIHFDTSHKVDVFLLKRELFPLAEMERRQRSRLAPDAPEQVWMASVEDTILAKLDWYRLGGGVSDRQWGDVTGVLKVQGERLDFAYLHQWAKELGVAELLKRALEDSGVGPPSQ
jgi:hypothetical protein